MQPITAAEIHISDVATFRQCRRRWSWSSLLRGNLTPNSIYAPFFVGSAVHFALDYYYRYGVTPDDAIDQFLYDHEMTTRKLNNAAYEADLAVIEHNAQLVRGMLSHYLHWQATDKSLYADRHLDFLTIEQKYLVKMRTPRNRVDPRFVLSVKPDGVVRHRKTGKLYLFETKTTRSITERMKLLPLEAQANAYVLGMQEVLGEEISGIIYNLLRKAVPETPKVLQNGYLSKNKQIDTTAEQYVAAIREQHQHEATADFISAYYGDILEHLLSVGNKFFTRVFVSRSPSELHTFRNELHATAREMINPRTPIYRSEGMHCNYCIFREPCISLYSGGDYQAMLAGSYKQNEYHIEGSETE